MRKFIIISITTIIILTVTFGIIFILNKPNQYNFLGYSIYSFNDISISQEVETSYSNRPLLTFSNENEPRFKINILFSDSKLAGVFTGRKDVTSEICDQLYILNDEKCIGFSVRDNLPDLWAISFYELDTIKNPDMDIKNNLDPNAPYFAYPPDKYLRDYQLGDWFDKYFKLLDYDYTSISIYIDRKYEKDSAEFKQAFDEAISLINDISKAQKLTNE
jgi:hypothetical protein